MFLFEVRIVMEKRSGTWHLFPVKGHNFCYVITCKEHECAYLMPILPDVLNEATHYIKCLRGFFRKTRFHFQVNSDFFCKIYHLTA